MDNESLYIYGATLMMVIGTFSCRELPLLLLRGRKLPDWFSIWLKYIPTAIFGALIFPDMFLKDNSLNFSLQNYGLWATICAFPIVYKTQSLPVALVAGTVFFCIFKYVI